MRILNGDCLALLPTIADNSIAAIVTDPPYCLTSGNAVYDFKHHNGKRRAGGGGFMGKLWDDDIAFRPDVWRECLRVLKPGGYMVAFGGCRTYHRLATAIEDAGFILHPMLAWAFGSGFPKATNASKMIDKHLGAEREVVGHGMSGKTAGMQKLGPSGIKGGGFDITSPATPQAAEWEGWAYGLQSLKPALEPICMAQKPMIGTGAQNILAWGVGAVNIDACRVGTDVRINTPGSTKPRVAMGGGWRDDAEPTIAAGRWPPNLLLDGSDEVVECFPHTHHAGNTKPVPAKAGTSMFGIGEHEHNPAYYPGETDHSTARFFPHLGYTDDERRILYCPKAGKLDRAGSSHPTVKPIKLIEWLCTLICPPNGTILDPFAGSGTTGQAAINLGFDVIMIERETEYYNDILARFQPTTIG